MVIVLVGLIIGYLVLAYFAARTWHVWHVVLLSGIFIFSILFAYLASANLKTQMKFRKAYSDAQKNLEREQQRNDLLVNGDPLGGEEAQPSLLALEGSVKRALLDRGRVWRNIGLAGLEEVDGQKVVTLNTSVWGDPFANVSSEDDEDFADEEPVEGEEVASGPGPLGLDVGSIVFAFRNTPVRALSPEQQAALFGTDSALLQNDEKGLIRVPTGYLGEFQVTAVSADNNALSLTPTIAPDEKQTALIADTNGFWVLYEIMPQDSHDVFESMTPEQIQALFDNTEGSVDSQMLTNAVGEYGRDQKTAEAADDPNRKWIKVVFKAPYSVTVDVQDPTPEPESPFDGTGRATSAVLRQENELLNQSSETKFAKDDEAILDYDTAQQLEREGIVTLGEELYYRQLRHYETSFRANFFDAESLDREIAVAKEELQSLETTIKSLQDQIAFRTDQQQKLTTDKAGFDYERDAATSLRQALSSRWQNLKSELSRLYRANRQMVSNAESARNSAQTLLSSASQE